MATLNTLRTRGGIIVSVVIGVALISFLLGDLLTSGSGLMNARKTKVGEIDGTTIGYIEYGNQAELLTTVFQAMSGKDALTTEEQDQARDMAWESMITKYSYNPGFDYLGISVEEAEQVDMVNGSYISPVISTTFVNRSTGVYDPAMLKGFISNLDADPSGRSRMMWDYLKGQMNEQRAKSKYFTLVSMGMFVNDLEVEAGVTAANNLYNARYIDQNYSLIADSTVKVSDSEIKSYYSSHKAMFKQGASRDVEYVVFDLLPSEQDYADAQKYIDELSVEFAASETPMQYATLNSQAAPDARYYKESQLDAKIAAALYGKSGVTYGPVLEGDTYTIARLSEMKNFPDSLGARHILLDASATTLADSLVNVLKKGSDFATLATEFSTDQAANAKGGDLGKFAPEQMIPVFSDACIKANTGDIFTVNSQFGIHVVQLTFKSPLTPKAQIATITYKVEPSEFTQQSVYADASKFISAATGSYENFKKATTEAALSKRVARIKNTDRTVSGMENSRELVRWAFTSEKGNVSQIMEIGGDYVVSAVTDVREDGIAPVEQAVAAIKSILIQQKKGDMLAQKMAGSSLDAVASSLGIEVKEVTDLQFGAFYIDGVGVEQKLIGAICGGAPLNTLSKAVKGSSGVFLFDVNNITIADNATSESEKVRLEAMATSYINERVSQALVEASNVKDWRVKFF